MNLDFTESDTKISLIIFAALYCLVTYLVILLYVYSLVNYGKNKYYDMHQLVNSMQDLLSNALNQQARIVPRHSVYMEMTDCVRNAQSQVSILTYFMYDWDSEKRTFLPPEQAAGGRKEFYESLYDSINNPQVQYTRIWMVPEERMEQALDAIKMDPLHAKEIELISENAVKNSELARFAIVNDYTTASFVLIDKKHLFFNFDLYDKKRNVWLSPYMIFIKDATELAFASLDSIVVKLITQQECNK